MSRPCSPSCVSGFSIVELMLALTLALVVSAGVLTVSVSGRRAYEADTARTNLNQNMRVALDLLEADIRQAGERMGDDIAALLIADGASGAPDRLTVRRNLNATVLRVCSDTDGTDEDIAIALTATPPPGCAVVPDDDADGWPENLQDWREYRLDLGGAVQAFIYNPSTREGEFFEFVTEDDAALTISAASGTNWQHSYPVTDSCRLYLLEERAYELNGDLLQIVVNADAANPLQLVDGIRDFQASAVFQDFTTQSVLTSADVWSDLRSIAFRLRGDASVRGETIERTFSNEIVPRNVLSR